MERCKTLINKLQEQLEANADPSVMIITVQMLHTELAKLVSDRPPSQASSNVSVVLPGFRKPVEVMMETDPVQETITKDLKRIPEEIVQQIPEGIIFPVADQPGNREVWVLNPLLETPTLVQQDEIKELNEKIGKVAGESLNDRLKTSGIDISSFLTEAPVRELKKAIGINDRFLFINELFRGDVDMYERSIKTINNFRILAEAEYWIERELKIKLAWDNATEAAMLFYQLVKRRFS